MPFLPSLIMGAAALLPAYSWAQSPAPLGLAIELRQDALVAPGRVALGDVAVVHARQDAAGALTAISLGKAPRVGYVERYSRAQLEQAIRRQTSEAGAIGWSGAQAVAVRTRAQTVSAQAMADAAVAAVQARFDTPGRNASVALVAALQDLEVPAGVLEVRARTHQAKVRGGRVPQWLDLVVDGAVYRSVVVQLAVTSHQRAFVARRALVAGELAGPGDFSVADVDVAGADALSAERPLTPFRASRAIRAGQALAAADMLDSGRIMRGDQVRVLVKSGQIGIETTAIAMAEAGPGQALRVRPAGSQDIVTGRVSQSGAVIIE